MASKKIAVFELRNIEILYKAQFEIPLLEIALPQFQAKLLKFIFTEFNLKFKDIVLNNQSISSNLLYFRKILSTPISFYEMLLGVDEIQTILTNPESAKIAWQPTLALLDTINNISNLTFTNQSLTFNMHCSSDVLKSNLFINNMNQFKVDSDLLITKGAIFSIKQPPWKGGFVNVIFDQSFLIPDGLYIFYQAYFDSNIQQYKNIFSDILTFLHEFIEPNFQLHLKYVGR